MNVSNEKIYQDIEKEINRARKLFPKNLDLYAALGEEFGEVSKALIQHKHEHKKEVTHEDIYEELIQTAVMCIRLASEGDPNFPYDPESGSKGREWNQYIINPYEEKDSKWKIALIQKMKQLFLN